MSWVRGVRAPFPAGRDGHSLKGAASGAILIGALIAAGCRRQGPSHYFRALRTEGQVDCGSLVQKRLRQSPLANPKVAECVAAARREHRPFFAYAEGSGVDSYLASGLVGDSQGRVTVFFYDSNPCGWVLLAPSPFCSEDVHIHRCAPEDVLLASGGPATGCAAPSEKSAAH